MYVETTNNKTEYAIHGNIADITNIYCGLIMIMNEEKDFTRKQEIKYQIRAIELTIPNIEF